MAMLFIQSLIWYFQCGKFFVDTYPSEHFYFNNPNIINGLFSYRKGFFVYTPLMLLIVPGFFVSKKYYWNYAVLVTFLIACFVYFSWWCWWYGGSFGMRAMIDLYPFLILPIAGFVRWITFSKLIVSTIGLFVALTFVKLNFFQSEQYRLGVLHWDGMNKRAYWHVFLRKGLTQKEFHDYFTPADTKKAMKGINEYDFNPFK